MGTENHRMPPVTDHQFSLYFFIPYTDHLAETKIKDLKSLGLPERLMESLAKTSDKTVQPNFEQPVWQAKSAGISKDFNDNIHRLFKSLDGEPVIKHYQLTKLALKTVNGEQLNYDQETPTAARRPAELHLPFTKSAVERLQRQGIAETGVQIGLEDAELYAFKTGCNIAILHCRLIGPYGSDLSMLAETVYALSRISPLHWEEPEYYPACETRISLGELAFKLAGYEKEHKFNHRVYIDTYVRLQGPVDDDVLKNGLLKLARHYTDDYQIKNSSSYSYFIQEFNNIVHCHSPEGSATAVMLDDDSPHFLQDYKNKVRKPVITPMQLLAFHESTALQQYLNETNVWLTDVCSDRNQLYILQRLRLEIRNFRLNFQHPVISRISLHNHHYQVLRQTRSLDQLLEKAKEDNEILSSLIASSYERQSRLRYCRLSKYGVAAVAFLTAFTMVKETLEVVVKLDWMTETFPRATEFIHHWGGMSSLTIAIAAMLIVFFVERKHCSCDPTVHSHGATKQLWDELLKHRMLERRS